ncbi:MAG: polymerase subunit sigma-70 [Frankiales bacterium]|nr:polymerase subunit sigma-70 [Frankiales bacterium]
MSSLLDLPHPDEASAAVGRARGHLRAVPSQPVEPLDFEAAVRRLTPRLQRYATRRLGDRHEAEELVQEALLRAFDHRHELQTEEDVAAWSTCVTGRLVIDRLRVRGRSTSVAEVPEGTRFGRDTAEVVVARDEARMALDALDAMPSRQAAVLWAREVEGLAYDEIGERFSMTEPAVRSVLSRARKALRKEFATRGGTLPAGGLVALAPWLDGLGWLDRLRRVATRAATPAALGAASLGVLSGLLVAPWSTPADGATPREPTVVQLPAYEVASARASIPPVASAAPRAAAPAAVAPPVVSQPASAEAAPPQAVLGATGVNESCVHAAGATAGGRACDPDVDPVLHLGPPMPVTVAGIDRIGIEADRIDCSFVPTTPLTECTTDGDDR